SDFATSIQGGKSFTPEEMTQAMAGLGQFEQNVQTSVMTRLNAPLPAGKDGVVRSLGAILGPEKTKQVIEQAMAPVRMLKDAFKNQDYGAANLILNEQKAKQERAKRDIMNANPILGAIQTLRETGGDALIGGLTGQNQKTLDDTVSAVLNGQALNAAAGSG